MNALTTRRDRSLAAAVATALLLLLALVVPTSVSGGRAAAAPAATPAPATHTHSEVTLSATPLENGAWVLRASVLDVDAGPVGGCDVEFDATIDFLGVRRVDLGSARTDASGSATLTYRPTGNGSHRIFARASFGDGTATSAEAVVEVTTAPPFAATPGRLLTVGAWAAPVAAVVIGTVWGVLLLVLVRVVIGIRGAAAVGAGSGAGPGDRAGAKVANSLSIRRSRGSTTRGGLE